MVQQFPTCNQLICVRQGENVLYEGKHISVVLDVFQELR